MFESNYEGPDYNNLNPRFVAYCYSKGIDPKNVEVEFITDFVLWMSKRFREATESDGVINGTVLYHDAFDAFIERRAREIRQELEESVDIKPIQ